MMKYTTIFALFVLLLSSCTPKVADTVVEETPVVVEDEKEDENLSPCLKFKDAPNPDQIEDDYVIYHDFMKTKAYDQAFELWQNVYEFAPAADGRRMTVYEDGIWFYKRIYNGETDSIRKKELVSTIMNFYDEMAECFGRPLYMKARKAFDYYYNFSDYSTKKEQYEMFKEYIDKDGLKTEAFAINPFTSLLLQLGLNDEIPLEEAQKYEQKVREIVSHNVATAEGSDLEAWKIVEGYAPERLTDFETKKGFFDCEYYMNKYYPAYLENPNDCDQLREIYSRLKWGACDEAEERFATLIRNGNDKCSTKDPCYKSLQNAEYSNAISCFKEQIENSSDNEQKAKLSLLVSKIYYSHLKNFPSARKYALQAASLKPNWGEPYLLIGRLYASSGPLCGPGRGWDSQIVVWAAIDMWSKAKKVDPAAAAEANKWINKYARFMPTREDIFQRNLQEGAAFRIPCWIQRNTTIRAKK